MNTLESLVCLSILTVYVLGVCYCHVWIYCYLMINLKEKYKLNKCNVFLILLSSWLGAIYLRKKYNSFK